MPNPKVLLIDDDVTHAEIAGEALSRAGYDVTLAHNGAEGLRKFGENEFDCVLTDLRLPDTDGMEVLRKLKAGDADVEVIIITGFGSVEKAVQALQLGAYSFLEKPLNRDALRNTVAKAVERRKLSLANKDLRALVDEKFGYEGIVGSSPAMQQVFARLKQVAPTDARVLVTGENGTGKELVARALHFNSKRRQGPLVAVNCGALTGGVLDSELFGHMKGAFTGALKDHVGKFEAADNGTLFLDEVGEMPLETQVKLLRVIENKEVTPVGSNTARRIDVRLISATNKNLEEQVRKGQFREDLYFRLKVVQVHLPPLRERQGDIPLLAQSFVGEFARQYGKEVTGIDQSALGALIAHPWPGNVRELRNTIEEMVVLAQGKLLTAADLPASLRRDGAPVAAPAAAGAAGLSGLVGMTMEQIEREVIRQTLKANEGNRERTARMLAIGERTLYRKIKEYGL
ncbi:MAG: sigma-54-dependent Fis family transcriptional regulator [Planctomycetes bacterium]|nr:sigma-54-dependent Fis family transcriptional regulator [Planctomycetota bacterium]MCL4729977.1 sigma-54 dependent transcriptional regulator [Planctomycetota bacterium]